MKISGGLENINKIEATLTITMTLSEWESLGDALPSNYEANKLGLAINALWSKARQEYSKEIQHG